MTSNIKMKLVVLTIVFGALKESCAQTKVLSSLDPTPFETPSSPDIVPTRGARIVYGSVANTGQFPHFGLIYVKRQTVTVQCGAGLISPGWILTAGHCTNEATSIEVRLGLTHRSYYEQKIYAVALARHPEADLALVKLASEARITNQVRPGLLPRYSETSELFANRQATISGMGIENQQTNTLSNYLKFTNLKIMSQSECLPYYGNIDKKYLCAKSELSLASTCAGDSGAPLVLKEDGENVIVGIVSFGAAYGCDQGWPVGYVRIAQQLDWILAYTGIERRA